ncbi:MAG: CoA pyrophosphatase [Propionibacteriaceae bacterium]|jgi:8-oxo-dGTP pyrophosphatase MutT (NUDIX family)|nr:CoA pyrophosphatase [Propionibacteriaceae bacterium]
MTEIGSEAALGIPSALSVLAGCLEMLEIPAVPKAYAAANAGAGSVSGSGSSYVSQHWAAVCALFSNRPDPELLFTARATDLRKHPGQISFPGGSRDDADTGPVCTALRETYEEVGLAAGQVHVLGRLPAAPVTVSRFQVVPVVAWWSGDALLTPNPDEVATVHRWPVSLLADPAHRVTAIHPSGFTGPAWIIGDAFLWGFTARIVSELLRLGGWELPWNTSREVPIPAQFMRDHLS